MDAAQAAEVYAQAILAALDTMQPPLPSSNRLRLCLALQESLTPALKQPELLAPTAAFLTELARRASAAMEEEHERQERAAQQVLDDLGRRLAASPDPLA